MEEIKIQLEEIKSVKIQGQGYLLNGTMSVPIADGNREYELIKLWIAEGNTPEPEFTEEEIQQMELNRKLQEASQYLQSTDWYYARKAETGEEVPADVVAKRIESRTLIQESKEK